MVSSADVKEFPWDLVFADADADLGEDHDNGSRGDLETMEHDGESEDGGAETMEHKAAFRRVDLEDP